MYCPHCTGTLRPVGKDMLARKPGFIRRPQDQWVYFCSGCPFTFLVRGQEIVALYKMFWSKWLAGKELSDADEKKLFAFRFKGKSLTPKDLAVARSRVPLMIKKETENNQCQNQLFQSAE